MPPSPSGRVYKTTPAQRAKAAAWRKANPEKSLAYGRAQTIRIRGSFIGPKRPRGRQRIEGLTKAQQVAQDRKDSREAQEHRRVIESLVKSLRRIAARRSRAERAEPPTPADRSEAARRGHQTRAAEFAGPPKPEAIATAQRRAKTAERQRAKTARFKALFVGPPKPPKVAKVPRPRPARVAIPRPPRIPKPRLVAVDRAEQTAQRELDRAGRGWDRQAVTLIRRASKVVLRPPKAPRVPRPPLASSSPPGTTLRDTMRHEVAQAKAQAAADKAAAKTTAREGKAWDRESIKLIRKTARFIREQVREAAQIAAKSRTPEQIAASKAAYEAAMASWDAEQRRIADETRNAFRRRVEAEQARMATLGIPGSPAAPTDPTTAALVAAMRTPVRRVPFVR